jgi:hypothetical protein
VEQHDEIVDLLRRIEVNQAKALEAQEKHLALAQARYEQSSQRIAESIDLQRTSVARQVQIRNIALPLIVVLMVLLGYLLIEGRIV